MRFFAAFVTAAFVSASVTSAWAGARVESSPLGVMVLSKGSKAEIGLGGEVPSGARLIVKQTPAGMEKAETLLKFADGCVVVLKPGQVFTVGENSPCAFKAQEQQSDGEGGDLFGGSGAGYVIGGLALLAVAGGVVAATSNNQKSSQPAYISP